VTRFVGEWLTEWAVSRPQEIAVTDATTTWTYGQLPSVTARAAGANRAGIARRAVGL
jgi:non-ribosomal peptide synthetase component E (peptide arylation enzyme)